MFIGNLQVNFVLGIGEASGMFPIDSASKDYNKGMIEKFDKLISNKNLPYTISDLLPKSACCRRKCRYTFRRGCKTS